MIILNLPVKSHEDHPSVHEQLPDSQDGVVPAMVQFSIRLISELMIFINVACGAHVLFVGETIDKKADTEDSGDCYFVLERDGFSSGEEILLGEIGIIFEHRIIDHFVL